MFSGIAQGRQGFKLWGERSEAKIQNRLRSSNLVNVIAEGEKCIARQANVLEGRCPLSAFLTLQGQGAKAAKCELR